MTRLTVVIALSPIATRHSTAEEHPCISSSTRSTGRARGAIKAYAFEAERCSPIFPEVPTAKEVGPPAFQVLAWLALFAPKATPKPILDKLANALDKALDDQNVRKRFLDLILEIPDEEARRGQQPLAALVKSDIARWTPIIKAADIKEQ